MSTKESIDALKLALATPSEDIAKAFTQPGSATTGLQGYDLEAPAKTLFPVQTPLRGMIARDTAGFGSQANWKVVTGINLTNVDIGVSEGSRGAVTVTGVVDSLAAYKGFGIEDSVTYEAEMAAKGFDDIRARAVTNTLRSLMIGEELEIVGGNNSLALGVTPTPALVASAGGALAATALSVICVALGFKAATNLLGRNNGATGQSLNLATAVVPQLITKTNADGTTDTFGSGSGQKSVAAAVTPTLNQQVTATVVAVPGAYAYAWFWGAAGAETLGAVTTVSAVAIKTTPTGTQLASGLTATDNSRSTLSYDGLLTQIQKPGSGAYVKALDGVSTLTSDGAGGIVEFTNAFNSFWEMFRISPDIAFVNAEQQGDINKLVVGNNGAPLIRMDTPAGAAQGVVGGRKVTHILNPITGNLIEIRVHPNMPKGTVMFYSTAIDYSLSGVSDLVRIKCRRDYYSIDFPQTRRRYEFGVFMDSVLQMYFPPAFGVITNIKKV